MLEKLLTAIRDGSLWDKAHQQKVLSEHALYWVWEERQQAQTGVKN